MKKKKKKKKKQTKLKKKKKKKKQLSSHKDCLFPFLTCYHINAKFNPPQLSLVEKSSKVELIR